MGTVGGIPTSITNMTPGNPFIRNLGSVPIADGVVAHSIIAVDSDGPFKDGAMEWLNMKARILTESRLKRSFVPVTRFRETPRRSRRSKRILIEHAKGLPVPQKASVLDSK